MQEQLTADLYKSDPKRVISIADVLDLPNAEIEDLIPYDVLEALINKLFQAADQVFTDHYDPKKPLVGQIEKFASQNGINLEIGWKVNLAKQFKNRLLAKRPPLIEAAVATHWKKLFQKIIAT